jgi:hypothetical protein
MDAPICNPISLPNETRVLEIAPGKYEEELKCSIVTLKMKESHDHPYDALSYCWASSHIGNPPTFPEYDNSTDESTRVENDRKDSGTPNVISCDGIVVKIGSELYKALKRMRQEDNVLRIWVDALCIDQTNISERNEHVKMMGQIYSQASTVRAWLGDGYGFEHRTILTLRIIDQLLQDIEHVAEEENNRYKFHQAFYADGRAALRDWEALKDLMSRAWASDLIVIVIFS